MAMTIGHGAKIAVLTSDPELFRRLEKILQGYEVSGETKGARLVISDPGPRKNTLPLTLPEHVPVIVMVPRRTFDMARSWYNAGAHDVLVRSVPPGTLLDAVQALLSAEHRPFGSQKSPSLELQYLKELSEWTHQDKEMSSLLQSIVDSVADFLNVDIVSLMLREKDPDKQKELLRIHAARGLSEQIVRLAKVEVGQGISGLVADKGEPLLVQDVEQANLGVAASNPRYVTKSLLSVPIKAHANIIGVLNVNNKASGVPFDDNDLNLLGTICNHAGLAIDNARLYHNLRQHAGELEQANEQLARLNHVKSEFIVNLSHELKTPLTTIQGYLDLLRSDFHDPGKSEHILNRVYDRSLHLTRLTNRMFTFFTLEANLAEFQPERFPLGVLLWTCLDEVRGEAEQNNITLNLNLENIDRYVFADRQHYRELALAMLENAVKFNRKGGKVNVYGRAVTTEKGEYLEIFVQDTGRGVPENLQERIFTDFKQTDNIMTAKPDGLGLGLAIARAIVKAHDCCLQLVKSEPTGSTFSFTIPAAPPEEESPEDNA